MKRAATYRGFRTSALKDILEYDVPLSSLGRWKIGGPADVVATPRDTEELGAVLRIVHSEGVPHQVIGDGSNILFDDAGYRGVIIKIGPSFSSFSVGPNGLVVAGAGLWVPSFVRRVAKAGLAGCTHAIGIPGRLGGLIVMNGGSQRKGIGDHLVSVTVVESDGGVSVLDRQSCGFAYRKSSLQERGATVVSAAFKFAPGDPRLLLGEMLGTLRERNQKFPRKLPNCGSVFLSDPKMYSVIGPPGLAIERVGLKGTQAGMAQISPRHGNFIVNLGGARSSDVLELIHRIRRTVYKQTGFRMECEVRHLAPHGALRMAHIAADELAEHP